MIENILNKYEVILASKSPRRKELLEKIIPKFKIAVRPINEVFPNELKREKIALHISELKSKEFNPINNQLIITADTIVLLGEIMLGKPKDENESFKMLNMLSGKTHEVITACTISTKEHYRSFYDITEVTFYELTEKEILNYIRTCNPFDKAGSYGIQEWMGYVGIKKMNGDYFNVMGLPLHKLYRELLMLEDQ